MADGSQHDMDPLFLVDVGSIGVLEGFGKCGASPSGLRCIEGQCGWMGDPERNTGTSIAQSAACLPVSPDSTARAHLVTAPAYAAAEFSRDWWVTRAVGPAALAVLVHSRIKNCRHLTLCCIWRELTKLRSWLKDSRAKSSQSLLIQVES